MHLRAASLHQVPLIFSSGRCHDLDKNSVRSADRSARQSGVSIMAVTGSARVVLVVEDDESMREAIGNLLSIAGFVAVAYESAEAMLRDQTSERPICVISDLHLPAMSGLDLLTALRRRIWHPPVIFITADDMASTRQAAER